MQGDLRINRSESIRRLVLDRPDKRNALDLPMLEALLSEFGAEPEPGERVVVLRAEGKVFCAGVDLNELSESYQGAVLFEQVLHAMEEFPLPIVSVVHGDALAGGCELALHSDFVIASEQARFGMPLAQFGLAPSWFLATKLIETAGPVAAREILLLGDPLPAPRMYALGCIARVTAADDLEREVESVVVRLIQNAPLSLRAIKATLVRQMAFRELIAHDDIDALLARVHTSQDLREGLRARIERRPPRFSGCE